ncbi:DUF551 domain-containing protein [Salmonella sp. NW805]|uniref:DUF551 domain-containing protein n=1 Tax=unclassified Salmonella TaxID=2614656 RepID=UPI003F42A39E|nr:hypothetical protein [Salmonella enterica subsp. enterica serovar Newport]
MTTNNHPAHGPVSLERLHQIREILSKAAAQSDGGNLGYAMADAVKVIDGAIAAFGAEPVAEIKISCGCYDKGEKIIDYFSEEIQHLTEGQKLYTAPPAPVVPDEIKHRIGGLDWGWEGEFNRGWNACRTAMLQGGQPVSNRDELQVIGWLRSDYNSDDKRDPNAPLFMLGSNDPSEAWGVKYIPLSGNSPVIPGGWISCSERMPDREYVLAGDFSGTHYLASIPNVQVGIYADWFDDEKPCWDDGDGNDLHLKEVTHWMPLPAAPQQEVKQ